MRTRSRGNFTNQSLAVPYTFRYHQNSTTCATGSAVYKPDLTYPVGTTEVMTDVVTPGFGRIMASGGIVNTPMSSTKTTRSIQPGSAGYRVLYHPSTNPAQRPCGTYTQTDSHSNFAAGVLERSGHAPINHLGLNYNSSDLNMETLAGTQAAANVDAPQFHGLTFVAELRETIGFLRNPLNSLNKVIEEARWKRRRRKDDRSTTAEYIADNWLSYRFAIRPLVGETRDIAIAVAKVVTEYKPQRVTARGFAQSNAYNEALVTQSYDSRTSETSIRTTGSKSVRAGVLYEYHRSPNSFGMGAEYLPLAGWEAIPYSFLLDYFANIGSFIEAITPKAGVKVLASWTTTEEILSTRATSRLTGWGNHQNGMPREISSDGSTTEELSTTHKRRSPGIKQGLAYKVNPLSGDTGKAKILDIVALGIQLLKS